MTMISKVQILGYRKFRKFTFEPTPGTNIIVGGNEAGKSTLIEAITLALSGRVNGARATDYLNPYWFNQPLVNEFFSKEPFDRNYQNAPEFRIDVYLDTDKGELQKLRGVNNMENEDSVGLSIWAHPDPEYAQELNEYFKQEDCPEVLPAEYYIVEWLSFAGFPVLRRPKDLIVSLIDSRTIQSERGIDYYTRQILDTRLDPKDRSKVSVEHRKLRATLGRDVLRELNKTLSDESRSIPGVAVGLQVDQSRSASWENTLIPDIDSVPLSMAGQGNQSVAKTVLALGRNANENSLIFIEEPENHLSHTRMRKLISYIQEASQERQVFITTHSSYILNRLGLNQITLVSDGHPARFESLQTETIRYFQKLSGFDTLRLILADFIVIVEGPSDEMIFNRFFADYFGREPLDCGVDVMSINGVSFKRCFELAKLLHKPVLALRDNDGKSKEYWKTQFDVYLEKNNRCLFVGAPRSGHTLEPQIENAGNAAVLKKIFPRVKMDPIAPWMEQNKTKAALAIAESKYTLKPPVYFKEAFTTIEKIIGVRT